MTTTHATPARPRAGWIVIAGQELRDIWLSARGLSIVLVFSLLLSLLAYLAASNSELNIIDQKDTVNLIMQITVAVAAAVGLLFCADAFSGERERETLESLLLTPIPRVQIALGKLVAAMSVWPMLLIVSIPYVAVLGTDAGLVIDGLVAGLIVGSLLTLGFASLGLIVSTFSDSNRLSLGLSFFIFVVLVAPTLLTLQGWFGDLLKRWNPLTASAHYLHEILLKSHSLTQDIEWLLSPLGVAVGMTAIALALASRLRLEGGLGR